MLLKSLTPPNYRSLQKLVERLHLQLFHKAFFNLLAHDLWPFLKVHFFKVNTCKSPHFEILSPSIKNGVGLSYGRFHSQLNQKKASLESAFELSSEGQKRPGVAFCFEREVAFVWEIEQPFAAWSSSNGLYPCDNLVENFSFDHK